MKYQITCDNCGTQFIVEAGEGQVIECQCPHCHGIMEVTLPLVSGVDAIDEEAIEQPGDSIQEPIEGETLNGNRQNLVIAIIIGLLIIALGVGAYFVWLRPAPATPEPQPAAMDTIPYETNTEPVIEPSVDTVARPAEKVEEEVRDTVVRHQKKHKQDNDTTDVDR
jgi:hypothetical protein